MAKLPTPNSPNSSDSLRVLSYLRRRTQKATDEMDLRLEMIRGILCGMIHLVSFRIVHRDLAARNVLLDSQLNCRIADFGLARKTAATSEGGVSGTGKESDQPAYYRSRGNKGVFALRWSPPEVFENGENCIYTEASDCWSFGMTALEIVTNGEQPFAELRLNSEVMAAVRQGGRPKRPAGCPQALMSILARCWREDANARPSFTELERMLSRVPPTLTMLPASSLTIADDYAADGPAEASMGGIPLNPNSNIAPLENPPGYDGDPDGYFTPFPPSATGRSSQKPKPVVFTFDTHDDSSYAQRANLSQPTRGSEVNVYAATNPSGTVPERVLRSSAEGFVAVQFEGGTEHDSQNDLHTGGVARGSLDSQQPLSPRLPISYSLEQEDLRLSETHLGSSEPYSRQKARAPESTTRETCFGLGLPGSNQPLPEETTQLDLVSLAAQPLELNVTDFVDAPGFWRSSSCEPLLTASDV